MLQLGLLRVISWPGSRFKKQRIKAQIICTHPLFVMFSKLKLSWSCVRPCLSLCFDFLVMVQIWMIYSEQAVTFAFVEGLWDLFLLIFVIPFFFAWTVSLFGITVSGMPQFGKSSLLVLTFWAFHLWFFFDDCLSFWLFWTITVFLCFVRTSLVPFVMHLDQLRDYPAPGYD